MKGIFFAAVFSFLASFAGAAATGENIRILVPNNQETVGKWEKIEMGIRLPQAIRQQVDLFVAGKNAPDRINPFDPEQLSLEATFEHRTAADTSKTDFTRTIFGFYYQEFVRDESQTGDAAWIKKTSEHIFRVRYAPGATGLWKCRIRLTTKTGTIDLGKIEFTCTGSASKGPVKTAKGNGLQHRYLQFTESRDMFFPVGMNIPWVHLDEMKPGDYRVYADWFKRISENGGNYVQLSMLPFTYGIEWDNLNNYSDRLKNAWELDQLIDLAHQEKIYVNLLMLIHDEYMSNLGWVHKNNSWTNNGYNTAVNKGKTTVTDQMGFFTDPGCKSIFKKRLRYILSRYGYSVNIPIIEVLSEIDNFLPGYDKENAEGLKKRQAMKAWFVEMKDYIKKELGYDEKLVGASYAQSAQTEDPENRLFSVTDLTLLHFYGRDKYTNYNQRARDASVMLDGQFSTNQPVIFDEMGANVFPTLDRCTDMTFHNNLWATAFMGCFGTGQNWWWENAIFLNGYEKQFKGISRFLKEENFSINEMDEKKWINTSRFSGRTDYEAYYLESLDGTKTIGWIHNTDFWWANLKNNNPCIADLVEKNNGSSIDASDNSAYAKDYARNSATGSPKAKKGYKFKIKMPLGNTDYIIKWYNTLTGEATGVTQTATSSSSGKIKFDIPDIVYPDNAYGDLGFKIVKYTK